MNPIWEAPSVETLTLAHCIGTPSLRSALDQPDFKAALERSAGDMPPAALIASLDGLAKALQSALEIPLGAMVQSAALKLGSEAPEVGSLGQGAGTRLLPAFILESSHHPTMTAQAEVIELVLRFDIDMSIEITGSSLQFVGGRIVGINSGQTKGLVTIKYHNVEPFIEVAVLEFALPKALSFAPGKV